MKSVATWCMSFLLAFAGAASAPGVEVERVFRPERLTRGDTNVRVLQPIDEAAWIWAADDPGWARDATDAWSVKVDGEPSEFRRFRCDFTSDGSDLTVDVSADERFVLLLDGAVVARGPQRGSVGRWHYSTYALRGLSAGSHRMEAVVQRLGEHAPIAQLSWRGGFVLKADGAYDAALTTGRGAWETVRLANTKMTGRGTSQTYGVGSQCDIAGESFLTESPAAGWTPAVVARAAIKSNPYGGRVKGWMLFPSPCPDMLHRRCTPGRVVNAERDLRRSFAVSPRTEVDLWWDLGDYYCAYPELRVSGGKGAVVTWGWAESLTTPDGNKGNRDAWKGKSFVHTLTDTFRPDGRASAFFTTPWWRCGRWCRLTVKTADEPLTVETVAISETRYPLAVDASFASDDDSLSRIGAICRRSLESCVHEMTFDCPYYEQQMYPGDSRIQLELLNALTRDGRMARHVMTTFDVDRRSDGMVAMNFPTRGTQESATYTLCWILMFGDYLRWHADAAFLKARMPGVRNSLMNFSLYENADGLVHGLPGWCFVDWVDEWKSDVSYGGVPAGGSRRPGVSSIENLFYLLALQTAAKIDEAIGEPALAAHWRVKAERLGKAVVAAFWDGASGRMADSETKDAFSEHGQALAILADVLDDSRRASALAALADGKGLARASTYFCYYLFEAYARCGRADLIVRHLDVWRTFLDHGARTTFETKRLYSRSDCHAWSACPLYFFNTALAGVTPSAPFFRKVRVAPQPAGLKRISARTPCPQGVVRTDFAFEGGGVRGCVTLPQGLTGEFVWNGKVRPLAPGKNDVED